MTSQDKFAVLLQKKMQQKFKFGTPYFCYPTKNFNFRERVSQGNTIFIQLGLYTKTTFPHYCKEKKIQQKYKFGTPYHLMLIRHTFWKFLFNKPYVYTHDVYLKKNKKVYTIIFVDTPFRRVYLEYFLSKQELFTQILYV